MRNNPLLRALINVHIRKHELLHTLFELVRKITELIVQ